MSRVELHREWEKRMAEFSNSGQSATAWCAAHDIRLHRFWYWARKFRPERQAESNSPIQWLAVKMDEPQLKPESTLTIRVGGACIEIKPGFQPGLLKQVVEALSHVR